MRPLAREPGPGGALLPASVLPRALLVLRLGGWVVCRTRPGAMLAFAALSQHVRPGRLTEYAWARPLEWARYLVHTSDIKLAVHKAVTSMGPSARAPQPESALLFRRSGAPARAAPAVGGGVVQGGAAGSGAAALAPIPPAAPMAGAQHSAGHADRRSQLSRTDQLSRTHLAAADVMGVHGGAPQWPTAAPNPPGPLNGVRGVVVDSGVDDPDGATGSGVAALAPIPPAASMAGAPHLADHADRRSQLSRADQPSQIHSAAAAVMGGHGGALQWPTVAPNPPGPLHGVRGVVVDSSADDPDGATGVWALPRSHQIPNCRSPVPGYSRSGIAPLLPPSSKQGTGSGD